MRKAVWLVFYWKCIHNHFSVCFLQHINYAELKYHDNPKCTEMLSSGSVSPSPNSPVLLQRGCISSWGCPPYPKEPGQCWDQILGRLMQLWPASWLLVQLHQSRNSGMTLGTQGEQQQWASARTWCSWESCVIWTLLGVEVLHHEKSFCKIRQRLLAMELSVALRADCMKIKRVRDMASHR